MSEIIVERKNPKLGLTVTVACVDMKRAISFEEMQASLIEHVIDCRHCLAMALFREELILEAGCCDDYKHLLIEMRPALRAHALLKAGAHIDGDMLEEYCFNRLSLEDSRGLEEHLGVCRDCSERLQYRLEFISCMKNALQLLIEEGVIDALDGAMAIHCPERQLSVCSLVSL